MARLSKKTAKKRDHIETAQAALHTMLESVDEVILRNEQALRRSGVVAPVLEPAIEQLIRIRAELRLVKKELNAAWLEGQAGRWMDHE